MIVHLVDEARLFCGAPGRFFENTKIEGVACLVAPVSSCPHCMIWIYDYDVKTALFAHVFPYIDGIEVNKYVDDFVIFDGADRIFAL